MDHIAGPAVTTGLHIRRCRIDARAPPGSTLSWADPEDHRAFAGRIQSLVLAMIEELIAPHLAEVPDGKVPRTLEIALRLDSSDLGAVVPLARTRVRDMVSAALEDALAEASDLARHEASDIEQPPEAARTDQPAAGRSEAESAAAGSPLALLLAWHRKRQLEYRIALFSTFVLARLTETVLTHLGETGDVLPGSVPAAGDEAQVAATEGSVRAEIRQALLALVELAESRDQWPPHPSRPAEAEYVIGSAAMALRRAARWLAETGCRREEETDSAAATARLADKPGFLRPKPAAFGTPTAASAVVRSERREEVTRAVMREAGATGSASLSRLPQSVDSALPFLAIQRLGIHGVLEAAAALGGGGPDVLQALAFAVALRCQASPADDGRWSESQLRDAAVAAGLPSPPEPAELVPAARAGAGLCEAACGVIGASLIAGHAPGMPLPLIVDSGLAVVFESDGLYPLCRLSAPRLAEAFAGRDEPFFLAEPEAALIGELDSVGLGIIASGYPGREETLRTARTRGWAGMTNVAPPRFAALVPSLAEMETAVHRAAQVWQGLTSERPLISLAGPEGAPEDALVEFDRSAALLAGFALADIAWTLSRLDPSAWASPDPLLAIDRFADLSATVEMTAEEVIVHLPLGARFAHLRDSALLDTVGPIAWWPGRVLAFRGG